MQLHPCHCMYVHQCRLHWLDLMLVVNLTVSCFMYGVTIGKSHYTDAECIALTEGTR